jgi:methylmalonyl-CoA mutase
LQEESALGRVVDPAGGSWYVEKLTDELAKKSWALFQDIDAKGGLTTALSSGYFQDEIARVAEARSASIAKGTTPLTGVSVFPLLADDGVKVTPHPQVSPVPGKQQARPLAPHRLGEAFEALRDVADAAFSKTGKRPSLFQANLGEIIDHNTRSTWVWNFLAAGGIDGLNSDGYKDADAATAAFIKSGASVACLCSSDAIYADQAEAAAKALKAAGATAVLMAGRPGDNEAALKAAGIDGFLFAGQNAIATLQSLHKTLGIT